jgi:PAS domain S-box-containing protein
MKHANISKPEAAVPAAAWDEAERARVLAEHALDPLEDDAELERIVRFAGQLCGTPIALVSLVEEDRQRFLARRGLAARETARDISFCAHAMLLDAAMEVPDAREDPRFAANPLVTGEPHIRFYAGHPLKSDEGAPLGSLCVIDHTPRPGGLTALQREGLAVLAGAVMLRLRTWREGIAAARELERSEARMRALADSIPDIAWSAGPDGKPDYFNRRWFEFTGTPPGDLGKLGVDFVHPDDYGPMRAAWASSLEAGEPFQYENRMRRHDGEYRWMLHRAVPVRDAEGAVGQWFGTVTDIDDTRRLSESRDLLAKELSHRIKNIFAVISGLVALAAGKKPERKEFADELGKTVRALSRAHEFVRPSGGSGKSNLHGLLGELFAAYGSGEGARVRVRGDDCAIGSRAATPLALVFHELATNTAKYGAHATEEGHVELAVEDRGGSLLLTWTEHGGSKPDGEPVPGFGTRLVETSVTGQLGGAWQRRFEPGGLVAELTVSKDAIAA